MILVNVEQAENFRLVGKTQDGTEIEGILFAGKTLDDLPKVDPVHAAGGVYCRECVNKNCCKIEEFFIEMELEQELRFCGCGERYDNLQE